MLSKIKRAISSKILYVLISTAVLLTVTACSQSADDEAASILEDIEVISLEEVPNGEGQEVGIAMNDEEKTSSDRWNVNEVGNEGNVEVTNEGPGNINPGNGEKPGDEGTMEPTVPTVPTEPNNEMTESNEGDTDMANSDVNNNNKVLSPGAELSEEDKLQVATNKPGEDNYVENTMGASGIKGSNVVSALSSYISNVSKQEAPDGTTIWTGSNSNYSIDIQGDVNGDVYVACFLASGDQAEAYLKACADALSSGAGGQVDVESKDNSFNVNGLIFDVNIRGKEYSMKVCTEEYSNTLKSPN